MNKNKLVFVALLFLIATIGACSTKNGITPPNVSISKDYIANSIGVPSGGNANIDMAIPMPDMPQTAPIYSNIQPSVSGKLVQDIAKKFDVEGEIREGDDMFTVKDDISGNTVEVYKASGGYKYTINSERYRSVLFNDACTLPSLDEAKKIAIDFLKKRDLLPSDVESFIKSGVSGGTTEKHNTQIMVSFRYQIGDYQVEGPGYRYYMRIGDKGEIGEVFIYYPEVKFHTTAQLKPIDVALTDLQEGKDGETRWMQLEGTNVSIEKVSLRYYLTNMQREQEYILPVYVFEGTTIKEDGKGIGNAAAIVNAIDINADKD